MKVLAYSTIGVALLILATALLDGGRDDAQLRELPALWTEEDWLVRRDLFGRLIGLEEYGAGGVLHAATVLQETMNREPETTEARTLALIELLEEENALVEESERYFVANDYEFPSGVNGLSESYTNYHGDLIAAVTSVADMRAINALTGAINTGGMVSRALVSLGSSAVRPVVALLEHPNTGRRSSAVHVLWRMLADSESVQSDPESIFLIREAMRRAIMDENFAVRISAVRGLARLGDPESLALIRRVAETDPFRADWPSHNGRYVVRESALKALEELGQ